MYSIDEIAEVSKKAFQEGYAQGLEAAANMADTLWQTGDETYGMAKLRNELRAEAERVRELGVSNENTQ